MPKRRTPAHECAVREGRLAQHEAQQTRAMLDGANETIAMLNERVRISDLRSDVTIERAEAAERREAGLQQLLVEADKPIPMRLVCPSCGELHVDEGEFATKPHKTHACQHCGECWMPCLHTTVGVRFLPGTKNER